MDVTNTLFQNKNSIDQSNNGEGEDDDSGNNDKEEDVTDNNNNGNDIINNIISELEDLLEYPDAAASNLNEEAIKHAMIRSAVHAWASRIMRKLYQEAAKRAKEDDEANKPHSE